MRDGVVGIARGEQHRQAGKSLLSLASEIARAERTGHDNIGEEKINGRPAVQDDDGPVGVARAKDPVAEVHEHVRRRGAHIVVVLDRKSVV